MKLKTLEDRLVILEECDDELSGGDLDALGIQAIRARQAGIRIAGDIADKRELLAQIAALEEANEVLAEKLTTYSSDAVRANDSLSWGDHESEEPN